MKNLLIVPMLLSALLVLPACGKKTSGAAAPAAAAVDPNLINTAYNGFGGTGDITVLCPQAGGTLTTASGSSEAVCKFTTNMNYSYTGYFLGTSTQNSNIAVYMYDKVTVSSSGNVTSLVNGVALSSPSTVSGYLTFRLSGSVSISGVTITRCQNISGQVRPCL